MSINVCTCFLRVKRRAYAEHVVFLITVIIFYLFFVFSVFLFFSFFSFLLFSFAHTRLYNTTLPPPPLVTLAPARRAASLGDCTDTATPSCPKTLPGTHHAVSGLFAVTDLKQDFRAPPKDVSPASGDTAFVECDPPKGHPEPSVAWHKNGEPIPADDKKR